MKLLVKRDLKLLLVVLLCVTVFFTLHSPAFSGEFPVEDEDVYKEVGAYHVAARKGEAGIDYGSYELWEFGHWRYSAKLKSALLEILYDSRLHPAYIEPAMRDLASEPGGLQPYLEELRVKQGDDRFGQIMALFEHDQARLSQRSFPSSSPSTDFIDGPANIRDKPKGTIIASLPDSVRVSVLQQQGDWVRISAGQVQGWTHRNNFQSKTALRADSAGFTPLTRAAFQGNLEIVQFLLQKGADINAMDQFGRTAIHWAAKGGFARMGGIEVKMVEKLLSTANMDLNKKDREGMTPLSFAVQAGRADLIAILLAQPSIDANAADGKGRTPLMVAVNRGKSELALAILSSKDLRIDASDAEGRTALYHAVRIGFPPMVQLLLDRRARTDTVTAKGQTLIHAAIESGSYWGPNINSLKLFVPLKEIDINQADASGATALSLAIRKKNKELFDLLMTRKDLDVNKLVAGESYLNMALYTDSQMAIKLLDRQDINVNVPNSSGATAVHMGWYNIGWGEHGVALARKILARNPDVNKADKEGETPLIYNITQKHPDMVRLLVQAPGIDLTLMDRRTGRTPMQLARVYGNAQIISLLEKAGAGEFMLLGNADMSPEGIPQSLLKNKPSDEAIRFYRGYLVDTYTPALKYLAQGKPDTTVQMLEFVLDEIIVEEGESMQKYSAGQRKIVRDTFALIRDHYKRSPRASSSWFKALTDEKKANYAKVDEILADVLKGKYDSLPDGELQNHPPIMPILLFRQYMAGQSIAGLELLRKANVEAAGKLLKTAMDREEPSKWKNPNQYMITDPR